jgi:hypothetical protein
MRSLASIPRSIFQPAKNTTSASFGSRGQKVRTWQRAPLASKRFSRVSMIHRTSGCNTIPRTWSGSSWILYKRLATSFRKSMTFI